jgi:hypothetical protein
LADNSLLAYTWVCTPHGMPITRALATAKLDVLTAIFDHEPQIVVRNCPTLSSRRGNSVEGGCDGA